MVKMIGASTCTASLANVCLGDDEFMLEMDNLTLAEYRAHPDSTFPARFGGKIPYHDPNSPPRDPSPEPFPVPVSAVPAAPSRNSSSSTGYSNISRSCYEMLERYVSSYFHMTCFQSQNCNNFF